MKNFIQSVLSFFRKKDIIKEESGSSFYINVVCKGREKLDSELFDKNSNEYSGKIFYSSFPIFFKNISRDTLDVQSVNGYLFISLEAKDRKGNWKPINEKPFVCGTGITSKIVLPPNEIIITSMFHYTGNYKTKFRLKFSDFVSREFDGSINEEQLR